MKVMVGVNGTATSRHAATFVSRMLSPERDELLLFCCPPRIRVTGEKELTPAIPESLGDAFARSVFNDVRQVLPAEIPCQTKRCDGVASVAEGMLSLADQWQADLLVVGADSHPRKLLFYVGGVAHAVAQRARQPVLVYRPTLHPVTHEGVRVLLADDGSPTADRAGKLLHQFTWPPQSEGWLIRVLEWLDFGSVAEESLPGDIYTSWRKEYDHHVSMARNRIFDELQTKRQELPDIFHALVPLIGEGHRIQEICDAITRERIDMVVTGSRHLTSLGRFLGSTSEGLLRHAPCSLLVVHEADKK